MQSKRLNLDVSVDIDGKVENIYAIKLFFLTDIRNAWHSVKSHRYRSECFHFSFSSAQRKVEKMRKRGTQFLIKEIPALLIDCGFLFITIVQINTEKPFKHFSIEPCTELDNKEPSHTLGITYDQFYFGQSAKRLLQTFRHDSVFWKPAQKSTNSIIVEHWPYQKINFCLIEQNSSLVKYKSYSIGGNKQLRWNKESNELNPSITIKLASQLQKATINTSLTMNNSNVTSIFPGIPSLSEYKKFYDMMNSQDRYSRSDLVNFNYAMTWEVMKHFCPDILAKAVFYKARPLELAQGALIAKCLKNDLENSKVLATAFHENMMKGAMFIAINSLPETARGYVWNECYPLLFRARKEVELFS